MLQGKVVTSSLPNQSYVPRRESIIKPLLLSTKHATHIQHPFPERSLGVRTSILYSICSHPTFLPVASPYHERNQRFFTCSAFCLRVVPSSHGPCTDHHSPCARHDHSRGIFFRTRNHFSRRAQHHELAHPSHPRCRHKHYEADANNNTTRRHTFFIGRRATGTTQYRRGGERAHA